jgi:hypothetical protein
MHVGPGRICVLLACLLLCDCEIYNLHMLPFGTRRSSISVANLQLQANPQSIFLHDPIQQLQFDQLATMIIVVAGLEH